MLVVVNVLSYYNTYNAFTNTFVNIKHHDNKTRFYKIRIDFINLMRFISNNRLVSKELMNNPVKHRIYPSPGQAFLLTYCVMQCLFCFFFFSVFIHYLVIRFSNKLNQDKCECRCVGPQSWVHMRMFGVLLQ